MCVTAVIAGASLLFAAVGTYSTIQANNAQKDYAKFQATQQAKSLKADAELSKIAAMEQENERAREFNRSWSSSMAAIGASNMAEHISFFQGVGPESLDQFADDVRAVRLNMVTKEERIHQQIGVVKYGAKVAGFNAKMGNIGALAGFAQDAMAAYSFYSGNVTPKG